MVRNVAMVVNRRAGSGCARDLVNMFRERVRAAGHRLELISPASAGEVAREVRRQATGDTIIAVAGGDGTIHLAIEGLVGRENPLFIVPLGTENLLARHLGIESKFDSIWPVFNAGQSSSFDLASMNGRLFATVAGAGFDGEVIERMTRQRRGHISHLDYFWPIWRTFWQYRFPAVHVTADGREVCNEPALVFVGNIPRYAAGLQILRHARWDDGKLDLCVMRCAHQTPLLGHALRTLLGVHDQHPAVSYHQVERVHIESDARLPVQADGDLAGELPVDIHVIPAAIRIMIPPQRAAGAVEHRSA